MNGNATDELTRTSEEGQSMATPLVTIDRDGDLRMNFATEEDRKGLLVNRHTLCLSSSVFRAMLGFDSPFKESARNATADGGIQDVTFEDDDFKTMEIIMNVIHLQHHNVPRGVSFEQLDKIAQLCDKYDFVRSLGPWPELWSKPYEVKIETKGYERWLFIAIVLKNAPIYSRITKHLILATRLYRHGTRCQRQKVLPKVYQLEFLVRRSPRK